MDDHKDPSRKTCLITGGTSGIGRAAALSLAEMGQVVIIVGRNEQKARRVCEQIKRWTCNEEITYYLCDLSKLSQVREAAGRIKADLPRLDILINNAGARFLKHEMTADGIEMTLATNHLGHFALTLLLLKLLERAACTEGEARVINVSSGAHYGASGVIENIKTAESYDGRLQYANSKLANVLFTYALAEKVSERRIAVNAMEPGGVATNFGRNDGLIPWLRHRLYYLSKGELLTPAQGADTVVYLATAEELRGVTGKYFARRAEKPSSELSYNRELQQKLWQMSVTLTGTNLEIF